MLTLNAGKSSGERAGEVGAGWGTKEHRKEENHKKDSSVTLYQTIELRPQKMEQKEGTKRMVK